jgi:diguanylate cyclase (GGDEF)-like protein/PAS domain S-box-containing protein
MTLRIHDPALDRLARAADAIAREPRAGASRATLSQALDLMPDAVFFCDRALRVVDVNAPAVGSSGYVRSELLALGLFDLVSDAGDGSLREALARLQNRESLEASLGARQRTKNGESFAVRIQLQVVEDEVEPGLVVVVHSGGDSQELRDIAALGADCDFVTRLPTRSALERCLGDAERRARRKQQALAVLFIDLDRFKHVNDAYGHWAGDAALAAVADRLRASVRPGDFVARYGGDEFVVLLENVGSDDEVERIAQRIRAELGAPLDVHGRRVQLTASVGVAIGHPFSPAAALVNEADQAMYRVKRGAAQLGA